MALVSPSAVVSVFGILVTVAGSVPAGMEDTPASGEWRAGLLRVSGQRQPGMRGTVGGADRSNHPRSRSTTTTVPRPFTKAMLSSRAVSRLPQPTSTTNRPLRSRQQVSRNRQRMKSGSPLGALALCRAINKKLITSCRLVPVATGVVRGNDYDTLTNTTLPVEGSVDPETQRVAWTVGDNKTAVDETGGWGADQRRINVADPVW